MQVGNNIMFKMIGNIYDTRKAHYIIYFYVYLFCRIKIIIVVTFIKIFFVNICRSVINVQQQILAGSTPVHGMQNCSNSGNNVGNITNFGRNISMDAMAVPSVGSPNTPNPSPRPNSVTSQPTSVQPADQVRKRIILKSDIVHNRK